jgi:hypothetical protein
MRYSLVFTIAIFLLCACKKDKYTTAPQIKFKSISPDAITSGTFSADPVLTISVTDAEGDLGITSKDTAFIYIKSLLTNDSDSIAFPDLAAATKSNFKADVDITISSRVLKCKSLPSGALHTDIVYFEVYIKDFGKNKSNVIQSDKPLYYTCR